MGVALGGGSLRLQKGAMREQVFEHSSCDGGRRGRNAAAELVHQASSWGDRKGSCLFPPSQLSIPQETEAGET